MSACLLYTSTGEVVGKRITSKHVANALRADGLATTLGGVLNSFPVSYTHLRRTGAGMDPGSVEQVVLARTIEAELIGITEHVLVAVG